MAMELGNLTFNEWVPDDYTNPLPVRATAAAQTNGGTAFYSWGIYEVGQTITIKWDAMSKTLFDSLVSLFRADAATTWKPENGYSYGVQILDIDGALVTTQDNAYRQSITLTLLVLTRTAII